MASTREIAHVLWARCLEADHKPGRVQFTKYLYLIDYCHWRFKGQQLTDANWIFYHYGPWSSEAGVAMNELAGEYGFSWGEEEETILKYCRVEEPPPQLGPTIEGIIQHILRAFGTLDLNRLLDFAYNQTEPMLGAKRGERLDFTAVPTDKTMPLFKPPSARPQDFKLSPTRTAQLAAMREKRTQLKTANERWEREREIPAFHEALRLLAQETAAAFPQASFKLDLPPEAVTSLGRE